MQLINEATQQSMMAEGVRIVGAKMAQGVNRWDINDIIEVEGRLEEKQC